MPSDEWSVWIGRENWETDADGRRDRIVRNKIEIGKRFHWISDAKCTISPKDDGSLELVLAASTEHEALFSDSTVKARIELNLTWSQVADLNELLSKAISHRLNETDEVDE